MRTREERNIKALCTVKLLPAISVTPGYATKLLYFMRTSTQSENCLVISKVQYIKKKIKTVRMTDLPALH